MKLSKINSSNEKLLKKQFEEIRHTIIRQSTNNGINSPDNAMDALIERFIKAY